MKQKYTFYTAFFLASFFLAGILSPLGLHAQVTAYDGVAPGPAGYLAFQPAPGPLGFEDYTLDPVLSPLDSLELTEIQFVGGIDVVDSVLEFNFYDDMGSFVTSFTIALPQSGNFIWTITVGPGTVIPNTGILEVVSLGSGVNGQWIVTDGSPAVGTDDPMFGTASTLGYRHNFALTGNPVAAGPPQVVPTLSEWGLIILALLFLTGGTLVLIRQRRKARATA